MNIADSPILTRRTLTALLGLAFLLLIIRPGLAGSRAASTGGPKKPRPNIVMILIDDQTMNTIGAYGGDVYTPNLDRMAAEGIMFNQAYVSSSVCTPSRYSYLTGRYAGNSYSKHYVAQVGEKENYQGFPGFNMGLEGDRMNVGNVLRQAGYRTGFVGKYHLLSPEDQPALYVGEDALIPKYGEGGKGVKPGPEVSEIFAHNERWGRKYLKRVGFEWAKHIYLENMAPPYDAHNPDWTLQAVEEFLNTRDERPFFIQYCPTLLHGPSSSWEKSLDFPEYTAAGEVNVSPEVVAARNKIRMTLVAKGFAPTAENIGYTWIDANVGAILNKLDVLGIGENTLVIFAADHGREGKASLFNQDGLHIPMIMRWPKGIPAGIESDRMVQNIDMAPTYFALAGAKVPRDYKIDGRSIVPLLKTGETKTWRDHLYFEIGNARAVMTDEWKYIAVRYPKELIGTIKKADPEELPELMAYLRRLGIGVRGAAHPGFWEEDQLYHLTKDPNEMNNLAYKTEYSRELERMKSLLDSKVEEIGRPFGEFLLKGNAALPGQVDCEILLVKSIEINNKTVNVPEAIKNLENRRRKQDGRSGPNRSRKNK